MLPLLGYMVGTYGMFSLALRIYQMRVYHPDTRKFHATFRTGAALAVLGIFLLALLTAAMFALEISHSAKSVDALQQLQRMR